MSAATNRPDPAQVRSSSQAGAQAWMPPRGLVFTGEPDDVDDMAGALVSAAGR